MSHGTDRQHNHQFGVDMAGCRNSVKNMLRCGIGREQHALEMLLRLAVAVGDYVTIRECVCPRGTKCEEEAPALYE